MMKMLNQMRGIIWHDEGIAFIPANIELAGLETALVNVMSKRNDIKNNILIGKGRV